MNDNELRIQTEEIQTDGKDTFHFHRYEPTPYEVLDHLFEYMPLSPDDVLVDYGSGLGRVSFYASCRFGCRSTGIEFCEDYFERSLKNLETYVGNRDLISFCYGKAEEYHIHENENIFYFFNPFSQVIFKKVINQILASLSIAPRKVTLVLYYPEDDTIFYLENHTIFTRIDEVAASETVRYDRRERFVIYSWNSNV